MNNKVLVKLDIPVMDQSFDVLIPVNELIWKIASLALKGSCEITNLEITDNKKIIFVNKITNEIYPSNKTVYESTIRNGTELVLLLLN